MCVEDGGLEEDVVIDRVGLRKAWLMGSRVTGRKSGKREGERWSERGSRSMEIDGHRGRRCLLQRLHTEAPVQVHICENTFPVQERES